MSKIVWSILFFLEERNYAKEKKGRIMREKILLSLKRVSLMQ